MRRLLLMVVISSLATKATGRCPVMLRSASFAPDGNSIQIEYYNSSALAVQAVEFTLAPATDKGHSVALVQYSVSKIIGSKVERRVSLNTPQGSPNLKETISVDALEMLVTRVVFLDQSTWRPVHGETCSISFSRR